MQGYNVGLSPVDMSEIDMQSEVLKQAIQEVNIKKEEMAKAVAHKNELRTDFLTHLRKDVTRIKAHKSYTDAMGQELGIIGTNTSFDATGYKPFLSVEVTGGVVRTKQYRIPNYARS